MDRLSDLARRISDVGTDTEAFLALDREFHLASYAGAHDISARRPRRQAVEPTAPYRRAYVGVVDRRVAPDRARGAPPHGRRAPRRGRRGGGAGSRRTHPSHPASAREAPARSSRAPSGRSGEPPPPVDVQARCPRRRGCAAGTAPRRRCRPSSRARRPAFASVYPSSTPAGLRRPERAVADDPRMQRVDPDRRELERERGHEPLHPAVDRRHRRRAGVGGVLGPAAEQHDARRARRLQPIEQRVHDLGVADQLERDEPAGTARRRSRARCSRRVRSRRARGRAPRPSPASWPAMVSGSEMSSATPLAPVADAMRPLPAHAPRRAR